MDTSPCSLPHEGNRKTGGNFLSPIPHAPPPPTAPPPPHSLYCGSEVNCRAISLICTAEADKVHHLEYCTPL
ncbi:Uncharacterized protein DAT39_016834 [Clarias magur]|uniref:Uncharacterized protein n=1 Tax=Clarias magur TaxID=1594786 RepID=A0A8J4WVJ8_CLAMG|nr:Uncharacterized protein DAT39_016834 [Clarias magur]